jgi:hypothetical protein
MPTNPSSQALLVVLEASQGAQALRQLSHHTTAYTSCLVAAVTRTAARPAVAAALHLAGGGSVDGNGDGGAMAAAPALSVLAWGLRCLESIVGREGSFQLPATAVASILEAVAAVLHGPTAVAAAGGGGAAALAAEDGAAAVVGAACGLLVSLLRHRGRDLRRLMAPVITACRGTLHLLTAWLQRPALATSGGGSSGVADCAEQLGKVYQAVADKQQFLSGYCHLLLTDYVIAAAAAEADSAVAGALRRGAHALYGAVAPAELQHVHTVLGQGPIGPARRAVLAELRTSYGKDFKYKGKT